MNYKEIVIFEDTEGRDFYFFRETIVETAYNDKGFPITNNWAWIENINTGDTQKVKHEYLIFVSPKNDHSEVFREIITKIKNNKK